ncbi:hypothetical protein PTD2_01346 [Pseudoalteromonas tunicata D2]|uniref:Uncharacterized protein n=1 Tax=Pseudoalteromonas tunicata D2 TaxID=87626 RepID=A4C3P0_9GAMM|nr:hypothetical protein PTD2_01346 [Pseudoalteromonas tunicata D2]
MIFHGVLYLASFSYSEKNHYFAQPRPLFYLPAGGYLCHLFILIIFICSSIAAAFFLTTLIGITTIIGLP